MSCQTATSKVCVCGGGGVGRGCTVDYVFLVAPPPISPFSPPPLLSLLHHLLQPYTDCISAEMTIFTCELYFSDDKNVKSPITGFCTHEVTIEVALTPLKATHRHNRQTCTSEGESLKIKETSFYEW